MIQFKSKYSFIESDTLTLQEAYKLGYKEYYTGRPCKHGHVEWRSLPGGACKSCSKLHRDKWFYNFVNDPRSQGNETKGIKIAAMRHKLRLEKEHRDAIKLAEKLQKLLDNYKK